MSGLDMQSLLGPVGTGMTPFPIPSPGNVQLGQYQPTPMSLGLPQYIQNSLPPMPHSMNQFNSYLTGGFVSPQTMGALAAAPGQFLSGAPVGPITDQARAQHRLEDELKALDAQISQQRALGQPTGHLESQRKMLAAEWVKAVSGTLKLPTNEGQSVAEKYPAPAGPAPIPTAAAPAPAPDPASFSVPAPQFPNVPAPQFPAGQTYTSPTFPAPSSPTSDILGGLAAGAMHTNPMASPATLLFNVGMGALAGGAQHRHHQAALAEKHATARNAYQRFVETQRGRRGAEKAQFALGAARLKALEAATKARFTAKPIVSGNEVLLPITANGRTTYKAMQLGAGASTAAVTPGQIFNVLLGEKGGPEALAKIAGTMSPKLANQLRIGGFSPQTLSTTVVAQVIDKIRATDPQLYAAILQRAALVNSLKKR